MERYVPLSCIPGVACLLRFGAAYAWATEKSAAWVAVKCDSIAYPVQECGWQNWYVLDGILLVYLMLSKSVNLCCCRSELELDKVWVGRSFLHSSSAGPVHV